MTLIPEYVNLSDLKALILRALQEDIGTGDVTCEATIPEGTRATGRFVAKESGVLAGVDVARMVFQAVDEKLVFDFPAKDGATVSLQETIGTISGNATSILMGERLALNFMQRMSGIASLTHRMGAELKGSHSRLLDTRKTVPGLRALDKWAVAIGGGLNHRVGLFDMILIKENHVAAAGGIRQALDGAVRRSSGTDLRIEIEVRSLDELEQVLAHGAAHRVMLDNFVEMNGDETDTTLLKRALELIDGRMETEASGNVNLQSLRAIGQTGVDYISSGALTHSVRALDISLLVTIDG